MQSAHHGPQQVLAVVVAASLISSLAPPPSRAATEPRHASQIASALWQLPRRSDSRPGKAPGVASASLAMSPDLGNSSELRQASNLHSKRKTVVPVLATGPDNLLTPSLEAKAIVKRSQVGGTRIPGARPLAFIENKGQFDNRVKFQVSGHGQTLWLTDSGIVFDFLWAKSHQTDPAYLEAQPGNSNSYSPRMVQDPRIQKPSPADMDRHVIVIYQDFVGASANPTIETKTVEEGVYNYLSGSDPSKWQTQVHGFAEVVYHDLWPGVDLRLYGNGPDLEQEFIVKPGADLGQVSVAYRGIHGLEVAKDGALLIRTPAGQMRETAPQIYQEIADRRIPVQGQFKLLTETSYTFDVAAHDAQYALVIDPTLLYSTFLGGSAGNDFYTTGNREVATGIAVDTSGNAYVTGYTYSTDFPTTAGAFQTSTSPGQNSFITKLNPSGSSPIYSTYFNGSSAAVYTSSVAVDQNGNAYVAGWNAQNGFPTTPNAYSQSCQGSGFLTVLNPSGSGLVYSSCFGGSSNGSSPFVTSMAADAQGRAFVTGYIGEGEGAGIPTTPNAYQPSYPGARRSGFVTVFDTTASGASSIFYSTYLGIPTIVANFGNIDYGIAVDGFGKIYVTGVTFDGFPVTPGAFQTTFPPCVPGGQCPISTSFIAKLDPSVSGSQSLIYATYLGGMGYTETNAIAVDASGNTYVTGSTAGGFYHSFPITPGAFQTSAGTGTSAFVTKLNAGGSSLLYSTFLDGNAGTRGTNANAIAVDSAGNAYVVGSLSSINLPTGFPVTPDAFQRELANTGDFSNAFLTKLNPTGSALVYSSFLGGIGDDVATSVAVDQAGDAYVAGHTSSANFPVTPFAFQPAMHGTGDAFITKFPLGTSQVLSISSLVPTSGGNAGTVSPQIFGTGFHAGMAASLNCSGQPIAGANLTVGPGGRFLNTTFNLTSAQPGACDVVVTNPDGTSVTFSQAFTVQLGGAPKFQISLTGVEARKVPSEIAAGPANSLILATVSNTGNVDSSGGLVSLSLNSPFTLTSSNPLGLANATQGSPADFQVWPSLNTATGLTTAAGMSQVLTSTATATLASTCDVAPLGVKACFSTCTSWHVDNAKYLDCLGRTFGDPATLACLVLEAACASAPTNGLGVLGCIASQIGCNASGIDGALRCAYEAEVCGKSDGKICFTEQLPCVQPTDPNSMVGSVGVGPQKWIAGTPTLTYVVSFNNEPTASAPAQVVTVTEPLGLNVNLLTLNLPSITIPNGTNDIQVPIPLGAFSPAGGINEFVTNVDLRPTQSLLVSVDAKLNPTAQTLVWTFASIDPTTGLPPLNPLTGFLPPGAGANLAFSVTPAQGLPTGTQIAQQATIVFQGAGPVSTQIWTNTIDNTPPTSQVQPLPAAENSVNFTVQWAGADVGSGIQDFTIYVSDNGGPFTPFQTNSTATSAQFMGQTGHTYGFYSIARDLVGNVESPKTVAETTTLAGNGVDTIPPITTVATSPQPNAAGWNHSNVTVNLTAFDNLGGSGVKQVTYSVTGAQSIPATTVTGNSASFVVSAEGVSTVSFFSTDNAGNVEAANTLTIKLDKTPPTITPARTPAPNANGWNNTNVTVSFQCADALSGLAAGSPPAPTTLSAEGANQSVTAMCTDIAGNSASATVIGINIDKTPPTITPARTPAPTANGWNNTNVTVSFQCADNLSGLAAGSPPAPTILSTDGANQSLTGTCTDLAGNSASATVSGINIDKTPPVITASANPATLWPPNGKLVAVTVSGTMSDNLSGVSSGTAAFAVQDSYGLVQPSGPVSLATNGTYSFTISLEARRDGQDKNGRLYTIVVRAQDNAGNPSSSTTTVIVPHDQGN